MRRLAWLALACAMGAPPSVAAVADTPQRPYSLEDMLSLQNMGRAVFSGDGRWLVYEVQGPLTSAGRWDLESFSIQRTGRLFVVDVTHGGAPRRLLKLPQGVGESMGALSPDGRRLIVYRLVGHRNEMGVIALDTGKVRWSGRMVDLDMWFSLARWRDNTEVMALSTNPDTPSFVLNRGWQTQARTEAGWRAAEAGKLSVLALYGGPQSPRNPPWREAELIGFQVDTGRVRSLAKGPYLNLALSPDGKWAALTTAMEPVTIDAQSIARNDAFNRRRRLEMVDLRTGATKLPCAHCDMVANQVSWSVDSRAVILAARPDTAKAGDWSAVRYWRLDTAGQATKLSETLSPGIVKTIGGANDSLKPDAGWLDGAPAILAHRQEEPTVAWWRIDETGPQRIIDGLSPDGGKRIASTSTSFLIQTKDGLSALGRSGALPVASPTAKVTPLLETPSDLPRAVAIQTPDDARILGPNGASRRVARLPSGANVTTASPATGAVFSVAKSPQGVSRLILSAPGAAPRTLATLNGGLAGVDIVPPRPIVHRTPYGETVTSWLYLPSGHKPTDERPLIVVEYPGSSYRSPPSSAAPDMRNYTTNVRVMVGAGYAVLVVSLPLPETANPATGMADALLLGVDAALASEPGLSRSRLALWGHSFGAYGALIAATQTSRFKAVIASSGVANLISMYGEQGYQAFGTPEVMLSPSAMFGWSETGQGRMMGPPWAQVQRYIDASPMFHAEKITAPVLLIQGDLDIGGRQSLEMFSTLYRLGKSVELRYYRGEGHVVQSPDNVRDIHEHAFAFLQAALSATGEPGDANGASAANDRPSQ